MSASQRSNSVGSVKGTASGYQSARSTGSFAGGTRLGNGNSNNQSVRSTGSSAGGARLGKDNRARIIRSIGQRAANMATIKSTQAVAVAKSVKKPTLMNKALENSARIVRMQKKRAERIINRLNLNNSQKLNLREQMKNLSSDNNVSKFLVKVTGMRKKPESAVQKRKPNQNINTRVSKKPKTVKPMSVDKPKSGNKPPSASKPVNVPKPKSGNKPPSASKPVNVPKPKITNKPMNFKGMKLDELKKYAKSRGMKGFSKLKRADLVNFISKALSKNSPALPKKNSPALPKKNSEQLKNKKACEALFNVYLSKISEQKRGLIKERANEIVEQMMKYNIAFDRTESKMNKMSNVQKTITVKQYFNVLLIMWLDGIHDGYVNMYFVDWYKKQISSKILPPYHENDIIKMAGSIKENGNVLIGVLQYMKDIPEYKSVYSIIIAGIQSGKYLTARGEVSSYSDINLVQMCSLVTCPPDKTKRLMKINYLKKVLFDADGNVLQQVPRPDMIQFPAGWEKSVKNFLVKYFKTNIHKENTITLPGNDGLLLSIDQEYSSNQERPLTELIDNNTTTGLVTFGQALDPGSTMLPRLITQDLITMLNPKPAPIPKENGNSRVRTVNASNVVEKNFIPNMKYYLNEFRFDLRDVNGKSLFNLELDPISGGIPTLKFNGNELKVNQSAGKAGKALKESDKISKYFGDALQYLIFTNLSGKKFETANKTRTPFLGSGDSMALLGYTIFSQIVGTTPRMIIDFSESSDPIYHPVNLQPGAKFSIRRRVEVTEGGRILQ